SLEVMRNSFQGAWHQAGGDLLHTLAVAAIAAVLGLAVAVPLARLGARRSGTVEHLSVLPLAVPAVLLAIGFVHAFNAPALLSLRELDTAVVLPAGNETIVRRLSNVVHFGGEDVGGALALLLVASAVLVPLLVVLASGRRLQSLS